MNKLTVFLVKVPEKKKNKKLSGYILFTVSLQASDILSEELSRKIRSFLYYSCLLTNYTYYSKIMGDEDLGSVVCLEKCTRVSKNVSEKNMLPVIG